MGIKQAIKKIVMGPKASSQDYVNYLRSNGMVIGNNTVIYSPNNCLDYRLYPNTSHIHPHMCG